MCRWLQCTFNIIMFGTFGYTKRHCGESNSLLPFPTHRRRLSLFAPTYRSVYTHTQKRARAYIYTHSVNWSHTCELSTHWTHIHTRKLSTCIHTGHILTHACGRPIQPIKRHLMTLHNCTAATTTDIITWKWIYKCTPSTINATTGAHFLVCTATSLFVQHSFKNNNNTLLYSVCVHLARSHARPCSVIYHTTERGRINESNNTLESSFFFTKIKKTTQRKPLQSAVIMSTTENG